MAQSDRRSEGMVYLVGAGPGDPGLITLRGVECLHQADLVLYDYLVNDALLRHAPPAAKAVCLGRHGGAKTTQDEINTLMIDAARQRMVVVRLKGGDPAVFGRSAEEAEALQAAGVPFEMVPGVTAGLAAAAYAGIPVTHADHASAVALVTGQERHCKQGPPLDYGALADFPGTLVFYMGVTSARQWSQALIGRGKPAGTPAAIVRRCTRSDQVVIPCTLADLGEVIERKGIRPPAVILVGEAVAAAPQQWWFTARPLLGTRVLVTRPRHQADALAGPLAGLGAEVLFQPAIEISEPADWRPVDRVIARIQEFDWLVFSSANGVCYFLDRLLQGGDLRRLGNTRLAAIGPGTAEELARFRLRPDVVPQEHRAEALAAALSKGAADRRFLLIRASRGREVLAEDLTAAGGHVDQVVVYQSRDVEQADPQIAAALTDGQISWITVTSSAIAQSLARLFGESLRRARLASISPITSETLRKLGFEPAAEATVYTMEGVVKAIRRSLELLSPGDPTHIA